MFINVQTEARRTLFITNWLKHRSALIYRISIPRSDASPIGNQLWRTLLGLPLGWLNEEAATLETKSAKRKQVVKDILASCTNASDGVSINPEDDNKITWQGTELKPGTVPSPEIGRQILWELSELNFRCELVALDKRAHNDTLSLDPPPLAAGENTPTPMPLSREELVNRCFVGTSMLDIQLEHANMGLACPLWPDRRDYLVALRNVMETWSGFRDYASSKNCMDLLEPPVMSEFTESKTRRLETLVTGFYTQTFFNFFGRAAVLPRRL